MNIMNIMNTIAVHISILQKRHIILVGFILIASYAVLYQPLLQQTHGYSILDYLHITQENTSKIIQQNTEIFYLPYIYQPPIASRVLTAGKPFTISPSFMGQLGLPPDKFFNLSEDTVRDFVFVTAADTKHVIELHDCVASIQKYFPSYDIHIYDIGLTREDVTEMKTWCNVHFHYFNISRYPKHVRVIRQKAFKFLVIQDILKQHGAAFWVDASFRATHPVDDWGDIFELAIHNGGIVMTYNESGNRPLTNYAFSDPRMFEYLPTDIEIQKELIQQCSCAVLVYNTEFVFYHVLWWMYLCSLEHHCIHRTPGGSKSDWSRLPAEELRVTLAIHKYDQAALNTILGNQFGFDQSKYTTVINHHNIIREPSNMFKLVLC